MLNFSITWHSPSCQSLSKERLKSMKSFRWCWRCLSECDSSFQLIPPPPLLTWWHWTWARGHFRSGYSSYTTIILLLNLNPILGRPGFMLAQIMLHIFSYLILTPFSSYSLTTDNDLHKKGLKIDLWKTASEADSQRNRFFVVLKNAEDKIKDRHFCGYGLKGSYRF